MLIWIQRHFASVKPVIIDGGIYVVLAVLGAIIFTLGSDEAEKFISDVTLFWLKATFACVNAGILALKMFRSTAFADHQADKKAETQFFIKPDNTKTP